MEEVKELIINPIITYLFVGLATIISSGVSIGVGWIIKTLKKQGQSIDVLTQNVCALVQINQTQTSNISSMLPVSRNTIKAVRSACYSQEETMGKSIEQAKKSLQKAFGFINAAEDELTRQSDANATIAMSTKIKAGI